MLPGQAREGGEGTALIEIVHDSGAVHPCTFYPGAVPVVETIAKDLSGLR